MSLSLGIETFPLPATTIPDANSFATSSEDLLQSGVLKYIEGLTGQYNRFHAPDESSNDVQRLLTLNHERYAEEVKQGLHEKKKPGKTPKVRKANQDQGLLFD